jgi:hypothetical protein
VVSWQSEYEDSSLSSDISLISRSGIITFTSCIPAIDMKKPSLSDTAFLE